MNNETQILKDMKEWVMHGFGLMKLRPYCEFLAAGLREIPDHLCRTLRRNAGSGICPPALRCRQAQSSPGSRSDPLPGLFIFPWDGVQGGARNDPRILCGYTAPGVR